MPKTYKTLHFEVYDRLVFAGSVFEVCHRQPRAQARARARPWALRQTWARLGLRWGQGSVRHVKSLVLGLGVVGACRMTNYLLIICTQVADYLLTTPLFVFVHYLSTI